MSRPILELIEEARAKRDPSCLSRQIPYSRFMQIEAVLEGDELRGLMRYHDRLIGNPALPALHGGALGALLESTAIFAVLWEAESVLIPKTINVTVDYLRSARPMDTQAVATITKLGRRVANVRVEAWQDDRARPIAMAYTHLLIQSPAM